MKNIILISIFFFVSGCGGTRTIKCLETKTVDRWQSEGFVCSDWRITTDGSEVCHFWKKQEGKMIKIQECIKWEELK
jgi:hypothetical protein